MSTSKISPRVLSAFGFLLLIALTYLGVELSLPLAEPIEAPEVTEQADGTFVVSRVIDGDTVEVADGPNKFSVRLIGVNTPETVDPRRPVECFGKEASAYLRELVEGKEVILEADSTQDDVDKYGRLLRYLFLPDGTNVNKQIIADGYGYEYTYNVPYRYQEEFSAAQDTAKENGQGLWSTCE